MELGFSWQIFEKSSNIKFHENPSSGSRVVPCGRTDTTKEILRTSPKNGYPSPTFSHNTLQTYHIMISLLFVRTAPNVSIDLKLFRLPPLHSPSRSSAHATLHSEHQQFKLATCLPPYLPSSKLTNDRHSATHHTPYGPPALYSTRNDRIPPAQQLTLP